MIQALEDVFDMPKPPAQMTMTSLLAIDHARVAVKAQDRIEASIVHGLKYHRMTLQESGLLGYAWHNWTCALHLGIVL